MGFKAAKDWVSVLVCANEKGDCITKPMMLLYHSLNPRVLKGKNKHMLLVFWRANMQGMVDGGNFHGLVP